MGTLNIDKVHLMAVHWEVIEENMLSRYLAWLEVFVTDEIECDAQVDKYYVL